MKVIDLLNKIANGEEVPKKIKYKNNILYYDDDYTKGAPTFNYYDENGNNGLIEGWLCRYLNDEVEVIEDNEKLKEEIKDLKKQLEEEKQAYNKIYNRNEKAIVYLRNDEYFSFLSIEQIRRDLLEMLKASEPMSKLQEDYEYKAEVERLNNIINEIEDSIVGKINVLYQVKGQSNAIQELNILLNYIRELKDSDKE